MVHNGGRVMLESSSLFFYFNRVPYKTGGENKGVFELDSVSNTGCTSNLTV